MRSMRMAALAVAMTLMFSGLALARDHDHDKDRHDHWDKHGDRDRGRWEGDHRRNDGYYGGQIYNRYPRGYPGGYGYPSGGYGYPSSGHGYPSGGYGYPGGGYGRGGNGGYNFGYQDGSYMARRDMGQNKPFNPNPRNEFGNRTHGYNSSFGDKNYYRSQYSSGYAAGYESNYRGGRGRGY
ncbi:MAG: hypothetical protein ACXVZH_09580 [Terriglobales bacterium]